jgi:predicted lipoprotein
MIRKFVTAALLVLLGAAPGCKIVKNTTAVVTSGEAGDDARISALVTESYASKLVPLLTQKAVDISTLRAALAKGLATAGGTPGSGEGSAWSFAVKGVGKVVAQDRTARAAHLDLDTDGDGKADTVLQLGPVIKGSALRDIAPFYVFTDFRDQIEFAKLARALNTTASASLALPEGDLTGKTVTFLGALSLRSATDPILIVPVSASVAP